MKKVIPNGSVLVPDNATRVFEGMIFDVYQWPQKLYDGSEFTFEMLKRTDTVSVVCIVDGKVLVIDDEQPHLGLRRSFPGGRVDDEDASIEAAAKREILEETGYTFKDWRLVKVWQPYRKIEWFIYVWLAWNVEDKREPVLVSGEKIEVRRLGFDEVKALVLERNRRNDNYLGDSADIFEDLDGVGELLTLPEFQGQEVDR